MRRSLFIVLAFAFSALIYSGSFASAEPCAIGLKVHSGASILYKHKKVATCTGAMGCKCVSCWNLDKTVSSTCFALVVK
jgi:hypothetical protein